MSHKGNFNVTEMGRIALSLQELVERQQKEVKGLLVEKAAIQKMLDIQMKVRKQHEAKIEKQQEMIKYDLGLMESQSQVLDEYKRLLDDKKWPWQRWFRKGK